MNGKTLKSIHVRLVQSIQFIQFFLDCTQYWQQGKELIKKWSNLIKVADLTKDGWQVINEYESDELALGSEDEKKL